MNPVGVLVPAYGRDYPSLKAVQTDFDAGKDFKLEPHGCYCSIRDFHGKGTIQIRFGKLRKTGFLHFDR